MTQNKPRKKTKNPTINQRKSYPSKNKKHSRSVRASKKKPDQISTLKVIKSKAKTEKGRAISSS